MLRKTPASREPSGPGPAWCVRRASVGDLDRINAITLAAKASWGYSEAQMDAWHDSLVTSAESIHAWPTLVADDDGELVGIVQVDPTVTPWELVSCWVAPTHMRRGVGAALLGALQSQLAGLGQAVLHIDSDPNAERFYLAQGAVRIGEVAAPIDGAMHRVRPQLRLACRVSSETLPA